MACASSPAFDVCSDDSIALLAKSVEGERIDWLVNNAGILQSTSLDNLDYESMERQFRVNSLGPLRVTAALLPNLSEGSKVFIITSRMGSIDDNTSGGFLWLPNVENRGQHGGQESQR